MATKGYKTRDTRSRESKYQLLTPFNREVAKMYIDGLEKENKQRANVYESCILKFLVFIKVDLNSLVEDDINRFVISERDEKGNSISNINKDLGRIKALLKFCIENGKINDTPLKDYKNLKEDSREIEKKPTSGKSLTNAQLAQIESIFENPESVITMQGAILWYLAYKKGIQGKVVNECNSEQYNSSERKFYTLNDIIELDKKHSNIMDELIGKLGKDFGFTPYITEKVLKEIGAMVGVKNFIYRDVEKTRSQFRIVCPECELTHENKEGNWIFVYHRIVCSECGEKLKKKFNVELTMLPSHDMEPEKVLHPLLDDNFDSARKKLKFTVEDLYKLQEFQKEVGNLGERYVLDQEIERLRDQGLVPKYIGDIDISAGYDVISYDENGNEIYIEVKSSVNIGTPFFLSEKEYKVAKMKKDQYFIYRVENVMATNSNEVLLTKFQNPVDDKRLKLEPHDWKVSMQK